MTESECPGEELLKAYQVGDLAPDAATDLERHLSDCAACAEAMERLDGQTDGVLAALRLRPSTLRTRAFGARPVAPLLPDPLPSPQGYEILGELGRGGMGVVYLARQAGLGRTVALKMVLAGVYAAPEELERFLHEARLAARLDHPNIVRVLEVGAWSGRPYIALEYVPGDNLAARLRSAPLAADPAAALVEALALGVHAAHQGGVLHRDLKPANVLLAQDGTPKVSDFGLAKSLTDQAHLTGTGLVLGTPEYMAPEQARAAKEVGPAADIYALGGILYECLTGRAPFRGSTPWDVMSQVIEAEPVQVHLLAPGVPRDLETICLKCLHKEPHRRYESAAALADDLARFRTDRPILARPVGALERGRKWVRRHKAITALSAGLAAVLLAGVVVASALAAWGLAEAGRADKEADAALVNAHQAAENEYEANRAAAEARAQLGLTRKNLATAQLRQVQGLFERDPMTALDLLHDPDACPEGERDLAWRYFERAAGRWRRFVLDGRGGALTAVWLAPDGKTALTASQDKAVRLWDLRTGELRSTAPAQPADVFVFQGSADGKTVVSGGLDGVVRVWDPATGAERAALKGHGAFVGSLWVAPDGATALSGSQDGTVRVWDLRAGKERYVLRGHYRGVRALAVTPDGRLACVASNNDLVHVWDLASGRQTATLNTHGHHAEALCLTPDGKRLVAANHDMSVQLWDLETNRLRFVMRGHQGAVRALALTPDGRTAVSGAQDATLRVWDLDTGQERLTLRGNSNLVMYVRVAAGGETAVSGAEDGTVRVWDLHAGHERAVLRGGSGPVRGLALSADGLTVLSSTGDGVARVWDLRPLDESARLTRREADDLLKKATEANSTPTLAYSLDRKTIVSCTPDGTPQVQDTRAGPMPPAPLKGHAKPATAVWVAPGGERALTASEDGTVRVWDLGKREEKGRLDGGGGAVGVLWVAANGRRAVTGSADGAVRVWDVEAGREVARLRGHDGAVTGLWVEADGRAACSASADGKVCVWDLGAGRELPLLEDPEPRPAEEARDVPVKAERDGAVAVAADGKTAVVAAKDGTLTVWDVAAKKERAVLRAEPAAVSLACVSADGAVAVLGLADGRLRMWDLRAGAARDTTKVHETGVSALWLAPDGKQAVSAGWDKGLRIWDVATCQTRATLRNESGPVSAVWVTPGGDQLVTEGPGGVRRAYDTARTPK